MTDSKKVLQICTFSSVYVLDAKSTLTKHVWNSPLIKCESCTQACLLFNIFLPEHSWFSLLLFGLFCFLNSTDRN